jgi:acetyl esterase/lipase
MFMSIMKRKSWPLWVMLLVIPACNFPAGAVPIFDPTETPTPTVTSSPTPTQTPIPYPPVLSQPVTAGLVVRNLVYCTNETPVKLDLYFPQTLEESTPALIYVHGGGWIVGDKDTSLGLQDVPALTGAGYLVANVDYRRSVKYPFPSMVVDVKCAVRFLRAHAAELHIDPDRIGAWGSSAGGHIVSLVGLADASAGWDTGEYSEQSSRIQAVVDMFGPTDLTDLDYQKKFKEKGYLLFDVMNPSLELLAWASPVTYVSADDPPFLIIHGDQDKVVMVKQSKLLHERLISVGVHAELLIVQNANHNFVPMGDVMNPTREGITQRILAFFNQVFMMVP